MPCLMLPCLIRENDCSQFLIINCTITRCNFYKNLLALQRAYCKACASPGREQISVSEPRGGSYTKLFLPVNDILLIAIQFFRLTFAALGRLGYTGLISGAR